MASKRLMLDEEDEEEEDVPWGRENDENRAPPRSAKRHKASASANPLQKLLRAHGNVLSPITELAQNMCAARLEPDAGGTPKSTHRKAPCPSRALSTFNSLSSSYDSGNSLDDEYLAMFELEAADEGEGQMKGTSLPGNLDQLISGQLKTEALPGEVKTGNTARRCLSMLPAEQTELKQPPEPALQAGMQRKTLSMNDAEIMSALGDEPELIGDLSRPCALPCLLAGTRHRDLKTISSDTLARLIRGEFAPQLGYQIIDCRYPYEYLGGHIRGALNLYTRGQIQEAFPVVTAAEERRIYVFHCEFSSERGPKMMRFLRSNDRRQHAHNYPALDYPELYLLHNGYKEFYATHSQLCEPQSYVPMLAPAHNDEFRFFRAKTKSWQCGEGEGGDSGIGGGGSRSLRKSKSRLVYAE
ncbi:hypothetical protein KR018_008847 [Drosophila ironensis]|nr:hypothetical protein KR018_008847 [Drosophila ironensis]